jgi:predicted branched-subunit amino acid permease
MGQTSPEHALLPMTTIAFAPPTRGESPFAGVRSMAPLMIAYSPFALVIGSAVAHVDDPVAGWSGSWLIYGGSAHLAALKGINDGAFAMAIAVALLVNARLLVYSASIATRWRQQPVWFRLLGAAFLIDPTWALADQHAATGASAEAQRRFFLGAGITLGVWWAALIAVGAIIGDRLPQVGLELVAPLCLMSLIGARVRDRDNRWAAIAAAATALLTANAPAGTGLLAAIATGCIAAQTSRRWAR